MSRRQCGAALALSLIAGSCLIAFIARLMSEETGPEAEARRAFRRNLAAASSNWHYAELECTSPGCANWVKAYWTEAGVRYVFSGFRNARSVGGGVVTVSAANDGPDLVSYCYGLDGSPTKVHFGEALGADIGWAEPRAREFFDATPANE